MKLQIEMAAADHVKLRMIAAALHEDEASYLLSNAAPGLADLLPDLSGEKGVLENEVVIAAIGRVLETQVDQDRTLRIELEDSETYGEGSECDLPRTLDILKALDGVRFVHVVGEEISRGERIPPYATIRTDEGVLTARVDGDDRRGWEVVLPRNASQAQRDAADKVGAILDRDGWLFAGIGTSTTGR